MRFAILTTAALALALGACGEKADAPTAPEPNVSVEPEPLDPSAPAAEQAALAACSPATTEGFCGVRFGASPEEAMKVFPALLETYSGDVNIASNPNACYELIAAEPVQGITFLVEDAKVGRLDVLSEGTKTADGFGVGTAAEAIRAKYGAALKEQPNKYEPEVTELVVTQGAGKLVFEIQAGTVRAWRAGIAPTIDYVERCG